MPRLYALLSLATLVFAQGGGRDPWQRLQRFDANGDGEISREEFTGPAQVFERLDADGNGVVTKAEAQAMRARGRRGGGSPLQAADANRDGQVSREEWQAFFEKADENGDEILQAEELRAAVQGRRYQDSAPKVGDPAPAAKAKALADGREVDLAKPRRVTVLLFGSYT